jgi:hypothetical protein
MRFKVGFFLGCAAGAWAASKASQLRRTEPGRGDWPRVASSRIDAVNAEATAERVRAIGDLARERLTGFLDSPIGDAARARVAEMLTSAGGRANGAHRRASD